MQVQLILNKQNFDLIASGEKKKEFRAMSDRNVSLFIDGVDTGAATFKPITSILFFLGYNKGRKAMAVEVVDIDVEEIEPDLWEIVVFLGNILETRNFHL